MGEVTPIALSRSRLLDSLQPFSPRMIKREQDIMQTNIFPNLENPGTGENGGPRRKNVLNDDCGTELDRLCQIYEKTERA